MRRLGTLLLGFAILPLAGCAVPVVYASDEPAWGHGYGAPAYGRVEVQAWHPPPPVWIAPRPHWGPPPSHVSPTHAGTPPAFHRGAPPHREPPKKTDGGA